MPSRPCSSCVSVRVATTASIVVGVPPSKRSISGLQQPGHRNGQPWNHSAKRLPGPSASVHGTIWATLRINGVSFITGILRDTHPPWMALLAFTDDLALPELLDHRHVRQQVQGDLADSELRRSPGQ